MTKTNSAYIKMRMTEEEVQNIRNILKNKAADNIMGTLHLSITIDGEGYAIPIKRTDQVNKQQIVQLLNNGRYDLYYGGVNLLYELKPVVTAPEGSAAEGTLPDLMNF